MRVSAYLPNNIFMSGSLLLGHASIDAEGDDVAVVAVVQPRSVEQQVVADRHADRAPNGLVVDAEIDLGSQGAGRDE